VYGRVGQLSAKDRMGNMKTSVGQTEEGRSVEIKERTWSGRSEQCLQIEGQRSKLQQSEVKIQLYTICKSFSNIIQYYHCSIQYYLFHKLASR